VFGQLKNRFGWAGFTIERIKKRKTVLLKIEAKRSIMIFWSATDGIS